MPRNLTLLCLALPLLAACGEVRNTLGLTKNAPDEFKVVARPPLTVPPEFTLRPPLKPGDVAAMPSTARANAAADVLGRDPSKGLGDGIQGREVTPGSVSAENQFLQKIGADKADPAIRSRINEENVYYVQEKTTILDDLTGKKKDLKEPVVNAAQEKDRLEENKKEGKAVTEGETPSTDPAKEGWLRQLFK